MATFGFTINLDANGTPTLGNPTTTRDVVPDRSMTRQSQPNIYKISFGDGYEQRIRAGINNKKETINVSFNNRPKEEIDDITYFFDLNGGTTAFDFVVMDVHETDGSIADQERMSVVCENYNTTYLYDEVYSCTATFRRVYEL